MVDLVGGAVGSVVVVEIPFIYLFVCGGGGGS